MVAQLSENRSSGDSAPELCTTAASVVMQLSKIDKRLTSSELKEQATEVYASIVVLLWDRQERVTSPDTWGPAAHEAALSAVQHYLEQRQATQAEIISELRQGCERIQGVTLRRESVSYQGDERSFTAQTAMPVAVATPTQHDSQLTTRNKHDEHRSASTAETINLLLMEALDDMGTQHSGGDIMQQQASTCNNSTDAATNINSDSSTDATTDINSAKGADVTARLGINSARSADVTAKSDVNSAVLQPIQHQPYKHDHRSDCVKSTDCVVRVATEPHKHDLKLGCVKPTDHVVRAAPAWLPYKHDLPGNRVVRVAPWAGCTGQADKAAGLVEDDSTRVAVNEWTALRNGTLPVVDDSEHVSNAPNAEQHSCKSTAALQQLQQLQHNTNTVDASKRSILINRGTDPAQMVDASIGGDEQQAEPHQQDEPHDNFTLYASCDESKWSSECNNTASDSFDNFKRWAASANVGILAPIIRSAPSHSLPHSATPASRSLAPSIVASPAQKLSSEKGSICCDIDGYCYEDGRMVPNDVYVGTPSGVYQDGRCVAVGKSDNIIGSTAGRVTAADGMRINDGDIVALANLREPTALNGRAALVLGRRVRDDALCVFVGGQHQRIWIHWSQARRWPGDKQSGLVNACLPLKPLAPIVTQSVARRVLRLGWNVLQLAVMYHALPIGLRCQGETWILRSLLSIILKALRMRAPS